MNIEKLGIVANTRKKGIAGIIRKALERIPDSIEVVGLEKISKLLGEELIKPAADLGRCDAVIAFGGDGTILSAAREVEKELIPVLGIKIRSLGFLAEDNLETAVDDLFSGSYSIQERMRIRVSHTVEGKVKSATALNDVVIHGAGVSRVLHIKTSIDGTVLGEYLSDGVIISTPTGSTAYSLAAGGPIINPAEVDAFLITPLCPHSLSVRPLVVSSDESLEVEVIGAANSILLTVDGQEAIEVDVGEKITFGRSERSTRLIVASDYNFYELVREKLRWGGVLRDH